MHGQFVVLAQFLDAENSDDVLEILVTLECSLHGSSDSIVLITDDQRVQNAARRGQGVHRREKRLLCQSALQRDGRVQVSKGRGRCRIGVVVCRHVDGLHRCNRPFGRGGDAFLQIAHLRTQRGLIPYGRGEAAKQRGHLRACLHKAKDVVDEKEHVAALVTEVLGHSYASQANTQSGAWRLVHLAKNHHRVLDDAAFLHLVPQVIALTASLAYAGKDRVALMELGDVIDQLLDDYRLAYARTTEHAGLATSGEGCHQVDDLDARLKNLRFSRLVNEGRC